MKKVTLAAAMILALGGAAFAASDNANAQADNNPANTIHPNINDNNGPGQNASPNGSNDGAGNMHGIGNNPGQSGNHPNDDGVNGRVNDLNNMHGGIGAYNPQVGRD